MSIIPATLHFNSADRQGAAIYRGDDFEHELTFYDDEAKTVPTDLSAATITAQVRRSAKANAPLVVAFTPTVSGAGDNVVTLSLTEAQTTPLAPGTYRWDLQIVIAGVTKSRLKGQAVVEGDISR